MAVAIHRLLLPLLVCLLGVFALGYSALLYQESRDVQGRGVLAPVETIANEKNIKQSGDRITYRVDVIYTAQDGRPRRHARGDLRRGTRRFPCRTADAGRLFAGKTRGRAHRR